MLEVTRHTNRYSFSGAILGLPKLLKEDDIHAEYPSDTDDEYVTEKGFQPTLPGEYTKLSSALALFRCCRILGKVLEKNYPAATSHELSLQQMAALEADLDEWQESLPTHLKLTFKQDKPSTDVTGSRSPLLALAYYYTRVLIWRPAIGSTLGPKAAPALLSVCEASKHIIQIAQLLDERSLSFSFCLNKSDTLILCGMALLYGCSGLKKESKLMKDAERLVNGVVKITTRTKSSGWYDFHRVAGMLVAIDEPSLPSPPATSPDSSRPSSQRNTSPAQRARKKSSPQQTLGQLHAASVSDADLLRHQERMRRMTMPNTQQRPDLYRSASRTSFESVDESIGRQRHSMSHASRTSPQNLDYLSLGSTPDGSSPTSPHSRLRQQHSMSHLAQSHQPYPAQPGQKASAVSANEWEALLGSMDGGLNNVYDAIYGGTAPNLSIGETTPPASNMSGWSPDTWELTGFNIGDFGTSGAPAAPAALSVSEESLSSGGDELPVPGELAISTTTLDYRNAYMNSCSNADGFIMDPLENNYAM